MGTDDTGQMAALQQGTKDYVLGTFLLRFWGGQLLNRESAWLAEVKTLASEADLV